MSNLTTCSILRAQNLVKRYGGRAVVNGLSFHVAQGEVVGLIGPNGAGKTTAFYMAVGLIRPDEGEVLICDKNVTNKAIHERAKMGLGYLAQEPSVFRALSVEENILCILETLPLSYKERRVRLNALLEELHLTALRTKKALALSGGERRRLEITRALVTQPRLLLLDEPFANIDPIAVQDVKQLIRLLRQKGISVLITDHNAREISTIVDRSYLIQDGRVLLSGVMTELLAHPEARRVYFGEEFRI